MREEMDIAKEKRGRTSRLRMRRAMKKQPSGCGDRGHAREHRLAGQSNQPARPGCRGRCSVPQRTGIAKFVDGSQIVTMPDGSVERRDSPECLVIV